MNARGGRVEAAAEAMEPIRWVSIAPPPGEYGGSVAQNDSGTLAAAAITASDALLRTDEAVERVARAIMLDNPFNDEDEEDLWDVPSIRDHYSGIARAAITALLGEGE